MNARQDGNTRDGDGDAARGPHGTADRAHDHEPGRTMADRRHEGEPSAGDGRGDVLSRFPELADRASMNDDQLVQAYRAALQRLSHELDDVEA